MTTPLRPTGAKSDRDIADAFGKLASELPGTKRILRVPTSTPKDQKR